MDGFWGEMARLGKDRNPYRAGFLQFVGVAEFREKAWELYANRRSISTGAVCTSIRCGRRRQVILPRRRSVPASKARSAAPLRPKCAVFVSGQTEMQDIVDMGYVIIGSPDEVAGTAHRGGNVAERRRI